MKTKLALSTAAALFKAKVFKRKTPCLIGWAITDRCNRQCSYCACWQGRYRELSTKHVFKVVDELARMGTVMISLTGGEPLLREDIGEIIEYLHSKRIKIKLNSNGALVEQKIALLKDLSVLNLSLEGPEEIHDSIRGTGSYKEVVRAVRSAKESRINVDFTTVVTKLNFNCIDFILEKVREFGCKVCFQPATQTILSSASSNPFVCTRDQHCQAIGELLKKKKKAQDKTIGNSIAGLQHLYNWPNARKLKCACGWISCRIEPNGDVIYCSRGKHAPKTLNCIKDGFQKAFNNLESIACQDCWCVSRVELNLGFCCNLSAMYNQIKPQTK